MSSTVTVNSSSFRTNVKTPDESGKTFRQIKSALTLTVPDIDTDPTISSFPLTIKGDSDIDGLKLEEVIEMLFEEIAEIKVLINHIIEQRVSPT